MDRHQPLSTEDMWRIAENNDISENDYIPPKKPTKVTERLNHVQEVHQTENHSSEEEEDRQSKRNNNYEDSDHDEELYFTDTLSLIHI